MSQNKMIAEIDEEGGRVIPFNKPLTRYTRRLSDKILIAFHQACDQRDLEVAAELLKILETILTRRPAGGEKDRRRSIEGLVAAYERLWYLRHPDAGQG